ncbi:MAG: hypothetical protein AAB397_03670 [Patescibacteria group bacterium]|mgnify:CR=1 FL=1
MTELTVTEKEKILISGKVEKYDSLSNLCSWNKSFKVKIGDIYGIFKPKDGEREYLRPAVTGGLTIKESMPVILLINF